MTRHIRNITAAKYSFPVCTFARWKRSVGMIHAFVKRYEGFYIRALKHYKVWSLEEPCQEHALNEVGVVISRRSCLGISFPLCCAPCIMAPVLLG